MANWRIGTGMAGTGAVDRFYGLHTPEYGGADAAARTATVQKLQASGVKWVRMSILWMYMQPDASYANSLHAGSLATYDDYINKLRAAGIEIIAVSNVPAAWAYGANAVEGDPAKFANYMGLLAAHFKDRIMGYQIFNEIDVNWTSPNNYYSLLSQCYAPIKAADPNAKVILSGLTYNLNASTGSVNYLQNLYSLGCGPYFDIMAPHLYPQSGHESVFGTYLDDLRAVMTSNGDNASDMWVTEFGLPSATGFATQADQVTFANTYVPIIRAKSYIKKLIWYELSDQTAPSTDKEANFGVYMYNGTPKPVRDALQIIANTPQGSSGLQPLRVLRTNSDWNQYLENPAHQQYFEDNFDRIISYDPYAINTGIVGWDVPVWMYFNVHDAPNHRLLDTDGVPLYVPWPTAEGPSYPRETADISNAAYRAAWIAQALDKLAAGFEGFWIDDVNLDVGKSAVRSGGGAPQRDMSWWAQAMADFMTEIRTALKAQYPNCEILHNTVWYAYRPQRWTSPIVQQQISASDYINIETSFTDGGLNNGIAMAQDIDNDYQQWSLRSMLAYIDQIHALGKHFVVEQWSDTTADKTYTMAVWLSHATPGDGIGMAVELNNWPNLDPLWTTDYGQRLTVNDPGTLGSTITVTTTTHDIVFTPVNVNSASITLN